MSAIYFLSWEPPLLKPNGGTFRNVTRVTLWGHDHFRNNVRLFMVMEALDLGPTYYCVMRTFNPGFSERLFLLIQFLPHQKIYVYPYFGSPFRGPLIGQFGLASSVLRYIVAVFLRMKLPTIALLVMIASVTMQWMDLRYRQSIPMV